MPVLLTPALFTIIERLFSVEEEDNIAALLLWRICTPFPESPNLIFTSPVLS